MRVRNIGPIEVQNDDGSWRLLTEDDLRGPAGAPGAGFVDDGSPFLVGGPVVPGNALKSDGAFVSHAGIYYNPWNHRSFMQAALAIAEINDPSEIRLRRDPGMNVNWLSGGEPDSAGPGLPAEIYHKRPGGSSIVAVAAADGATTVTLNRSDWFPITWPGGIEGVEFMVDGQAIAYDTFVSFQGVICGDHVAESPTIDVCPPNNGEIPTSGRGQLQNKMQIAWTGVTRILDATVDGALIAGATEIVLAGDLSDIPAEGTIRIDLDGRIRQLRYTSVSGQTLAIDEATPISRNVADGAAVHMDRLTGVTSDFETQIRGDHLAGATALRVLGHDFLDSTSEQTFKTAHESAYASVPASGFLRVESLSDPPGNALRDYPVKRIAYNGLDGDQVILVDPLPFPVDDKAWVWIEGHPGPHRPVPNQRTLNWHTLHNVTGLAAGANKHTVAEFSPRYKNPTPKRSLTGFLAGQGYSAVGGWGSGQGGLIGFRTLEDVITPQNQGGVWSFMVVHPESGHRRVGLWIREKGVGIGTQSDDQIMYPLHLGGPNCRTQAAGWLVAPIVPETDDQPPGPPDQDPPPDGPGQTLAATVTVDSTQGPPWPSSGKFQGEVYNTDSGQAETRIFAYANLGSDTQTLGGVTYDGTDGFTLADFYVAPGTTLRLADETKYVTLGSMRQVKANADKRGEVTVGNVGPGSEPGVKFGRDTDTPGILYMTDAGVLRFKQGATDKAVTLT